MTEPIIRFTSILFIALVVDLIAGDPEWMPHPVRLIGGTIKFLEGFLRPKNHRPAIAKIAGVVLAVAVVGLGYGVTATLLYLADRWSFIACFALSVYIVWTCLAIRSLGNEARSVIGTLNASGLDAARKRLSRIVGRDTENLSEEAVLKASAETVAENSSDAVVAPLFYLAIGGPALMMAYKAVNTLDSMAGYKNERYLDFGWASARLDDAANFIPARLTALIMIVSAFILSYNWRGALKTVLKDAKNHPSPNSGWPEAAVAGALGVRFGGPSTYGGKVFEKPFIGSATARITPETTLSAIRIMRLSSIIMVFTAMLMRAGFLLIL